MSKITIIEIYIQGSIEASDAYHRGACGSSMHWISSWNRLIQAFNEWQLAYENRSC